MRLFPKAALVVTVAVFLAGAGSGLRTADAAAASVTINNFAFTPGTTTIDIGDTVTWSNMQTGTTHTVASDTGLWDSGNVAPGATFSRTFASAGTFAYHCNIHPSMNGTIVVSAAASPTATATAATATATAVTPTASPTATVSATATTAPTATPTAPTATATTPPPTATRTPTPAATAAGSATPAAPATGGSSSGGGSDLPLVVVLALGAAGIAMATAGGVVVLRHRN